jgi:hypothetical protein
MMGQSEPQDRILDLVLAEFNALNAEITSTASSQQTLISLNITAQAAVAGLVVADKADPKLLFVSAVLSSALGLVYVANAVHIANMGSYITDVLRLIAAEKTGEGRLLGWVQHYRVHHRVLRLLYRGLMIGGLFCGFPMVALVWVIPHLDTLWSRVAWGCSSCLLIIQIGAWAWYGQAMLRRSSSRGLAASST